MNIKQHPTWGNISSYKRPAHLLRFFLAKKVAALYPRKNVIGITGSVGKTTTKEACYAVLSQKFKTIATWKNLDPIFNIPITLLKIRPDTKKVILEMGIEYPEDMDFYLSLVRPGIGIVTKIFFAHSEFLGGIDEISKQKAKLITQLPEDGLAILNWDDIQVRKLADKSPAEVMFFGTDPKNCHIVASNIRIKNNSTIFELNYGAERVEVVLRLLGKHYVSSALAAASLGVYSGMSLISIKKGLEKVEPSAHRLQLLGSGEDWTILDDTYNSSPSALEEALNVLSELPAKRRIAVLGEMKELGKYSEKFHRLAAQRLYKDKIDLVFLGGGDALFIADELEKLGFPKERLESNLSSSQLVAKLIRVLGKGDIVLVKGSRAVKLDEVVERLAKIK